MNADALGCPGGGSCHALPRSFFIVSAATTLLLLVPVRSVATGGTPDSAAPVAVCSSAELEAAVARGGEITFGCDGKIRLSTTLDVTNETVLDGRSRDVTINAPGRVFAVGAGIAGDFGSNVEGILEDAGHNIASDDSAAFTEPSSRNSTDPKLGPLGNYGGPTLSVLLLAGSPAIDAGGDDACPVTDQRGVPRPAGAHCDMGAVESILLEARRTPDGQWEVHSSARPGQDCMLLGSGNLNDWVPLQHASANGAGVVRFVLPFSSLGDRLFLRLAAPTPTPPP